MIRCFKCRGQGATFCLGFGLRDSPAFGPFGSPFSPAPKGALPDGGVFPYEPKPVKSQIRASGAKPFLDSSCRVQGSGFGSVGQRTAPRFIVVVVIARRPVFFRTEFLTPKPEPSELPKASKSWRLNASIQRPEVPTTRHQKPIP